MERECTERNRKDSKKEASSEEARWREKQNEKTEKEAKTKPEGSGEEG